MKLATVPASKLPKGAMPITATANRPITRARLSSSTMVCSTVLAEAISTTSAPPTTGRMASDSGSEFGKRKGDHAQSHGGRGVGDDAAQADAPCGAKPDRGCRPARRSRKRPAAARASVRCRPAPGRQTAASAPIATSPTGC